MPGCRWVPLTKGAFALVDESDWADVSRFNWHLSGDGRYAARTAPTETVFMHAHIAGPRPDHVNGNGLDNRRHNLRLASIQQNCCNKGVSSNNTSGFVGVTWSKRHKRWVSKICSRRRWFYLGSYADPIAAACAYNSAAREHFGDFAKPNRMD